MNNLLLERYIRWINPLSVENKLALISLISQSIIEKKPDKSLTERQLLFNQLKGSWSDVDDSIEKIIYNSRTTSEREINFDE